MPVPTMRKLLCLLPSEESLLDDHLKPSSLSHDTGLLPPDPSKTCTLVLRCRMYENNPRERDGWSLPSVFLKFPVAVVEWADLPGLEPSRDAVEVECML